MVKSINKSAIWIIVLAVLVIGVLLIPAPSGDRFKVLLFKDEFSGIAVDDTKWADNGNGNYGIETTNHFLAGLPTTNSGQANFYTNQSFSGNSLLFKADFNGRERQEIPTSIFIYSTSSANYVSVILQINGNITCQYSHGAGKTTIDTGVKWYGIENSIHFYHVEITTDRENGAFNLLITHQGVELFDRGITDWTASNDPIYFALSYYPYLRPNLAPLVYSAVILDNVEVWSIGATMPSLDLWLWALAIVSLVLIAIGSGVYGNCQWSHALMTTVGFTGLLILAGLLLNKWWLVTWAFPMGIVGIFCLLVALVHENWEIDISGYDGRGKVAIVLGIVMTALSVFEYYTLYFTTTYPPFWNAWL
jgi:hypothetical protein